MLVFRRVYTWIFHPGCFIQMFWECLYYSIPQGFGFLHSLRRQFSLLGNIMKAKTFQWSSNGQKGHRQSEEAPTTTKDARADRAGNFEPPDPRVAGWAPMTRTSMVSSYKPFSTKEKLAFPTSNLLCIHGEGGGGGGIKPSPPMFVLAWFSSLNNARYCDRVLIHFHSVHSLRIFQKAVTIMTGQPTPPNVPPPRRNKGFIRLYEGKPMLNKPWS